MATRSYTSRRELEEYTFSPIVTIGVPFIFLLLQMFLPKIFPRLLILDLPLIAVIFFAVSRRSPIAGAVTGTLIGLLQDALSQQYIGVNGMAKSVIGFAAASIGIQVDVENIVTRLVMNFVLCLIQSVLLFLIDRFLEGFSNVHLLWLHELVKAAVNTAVAIPIFLLLDNFKRRD
jgi:rod shape-determining protein MreD